MTDKLLDLRARIDALDERLVKLLSARARLVERVGAHKKGVGVYRPDREAQVLRRVAALNDGPLPDDALQRIYVEIMSACRALEDKMSVAYLGPAGTYSEEAARRHFGSSVPFLPCASIDEVFRHIEAGTTGYAVVPVENSTEGAIGRTLDLLNTTSAKICGEVLLPVHQCLMSRAQRYADIRKVYSHPQSLAQCQRWLARHLPDAERVPVVSNAEAAHLAGKERSSAALAGKAAAALYRLPLLARNVEDEPNNTTRFLVLGGHDASRSGADKTSLILATRNVPGAIHELLTPLADNRVSMTKLESRPARTGLWEYLFYVDIEGHRSDPRVDKALTELEAKASYLKNLGSYPAASR
jgi:chorismate mutase/prephenate dehydratase